MKSVLAGKTIFITGETSAIEDKTMRQTLAQGTSKIAVFSRDEE